MTSARIPDIDVWRAAKQIIDLYPEDPEMAAAQHAFRNGKHGPYSAKKLSFHTVW